MGINLKGDVIFYYNNPAGYINQKETVIDKLFFNEEFNKWLKGKGLEFKLKDGVFESLIQNRRLSDKELLLNEVKLWQLKPDVSQAIKFISFKELIKISYPDLNNYNLVSTMEVDTDDLLLIADRLSSQKNTEGYLLAISDIIEVNDDKGKRFYYVDVKDFILLKDMK